MLSAVSGGANDRFSHTPSSMSSLWGGRLQTLSLCLPLVRIFAVLFLNLDFGRAALIRLDDFDPQITYNQPVLPQATCGNRPDNDACVGNWWIELGDSNGQDFNNSIHDTFGPDTTASLRFRGTSISVFGVKLNVGARGIITLDGGTHGFDCVSPNGQLIPRQLLFKQDGLDPSTEHSLVIAYDNTSFGPANNRRWLGIDYLEIETPDVTSTSLPAPKPTPTPSTSSSSSSSSTTTQAPSSASTQSTASSVLTSSDPGTSPGTLGLSPTVTTPDTSSASSTATNVPESRSSTSPGIIAGAVIAGVILLTIAGVLLYFIRETLRNQPRGFGNSVNLGSPRYIPPHLSQVDAMGVQTRTSEHATLASSGNPRHPPTSSHTPSTVSRTTGRRASTAIR